jgi:hypothetical protein
MNNLIEILQIREKIEKFWGLAINERKISLYYISDIVFKKNIQS